MVHVENVDERASRIAYYITQEPRTRGVIPTSGHCTLCLRLALTFMLRAPTNFGSPAKDIPREEGGRGGFFIEQEEEVGGFI